MQKRNASSILGKPQHLSTKRQTVCALSLLRSSSFAVIGILGWLANGNTWFIWTCAVYFVFAVLYDCYRSWSLSPNEARITLDNGQQFEDERSRASCNGWVLLSFSPTFFVVGICRALGQGGETALSVLMCGIIFVVAGIALVFQGARRTPESLIQSAYQSRAQMMDNG